MFYFFKYNIYIKFPNNHLFYSNSKNTNIILTKRYFQFFKKIET